MRDAPILLLAENGSHPTSQNFIYPSTRKIPAAVDSPNQVFVPHLPQGLFPRPDNKSHIRTPYS